MNPILKHQFRRLDRALLALLDERVDLAREHALDPASIEPSVDDLLQRHAGATDAESIRAFFAAVARARSREESAP
jgi:hypothetical protein